MHKLMMVFAVWVVGLPAIAGTITAQLDRTNGVVGEPFFLDISVEGKLQSQLTMPAVDGLRFHNEGVQQSTQYVNGQKTEVFSVRLRISPSRQGTFEIPSIPAKIDGKNEKSLPLKLQVNAPGTARSASNNGSAGGQKSQAEAMGVDFERVCDPPNPYVGQQILCKTRFLFGRGFRRVDGQTKASSSFRRFLAQNPRSGQTVHKGKRSGVVEFAEILIPSKAGDTTLPPFEVLAEVMDRKRRGSPLDDFFGGGVFSRQAYKDMKFASEATQVKVRPLPSQGRPAAFDGLLGRFELRASISANNVKVGDTVTITAVISGQGIADHVAFPSIGLEKFGKVYADKPRYEEKVNEREGITSVREFKLALVPSKAGTFQLPDVEIPYFDPYASQYRVLRKKLGNLHVQANQQAQDPQAYTAGEYRPSGPAKNKIATLGDDLVGIHRKADLLTSHTLSTGFGLALGFGGGLPLFSAFLFIGWQRFGGTEAGRRKQLQKRAGSVLSQRLGDLATQTGSDGTVLVNEGFEAVRVFFANCYLVEGGALTPKDMAKILTDQGVGSDKVNSLRELFEQAAHISYGGVTFTPETARAWVETVAVQLEDIA